MAACLPALVGAGHYPVIMGLTMAQRHAVTRATAVRYRSASKTAKAVILDELCELTVLRVDRHRHRAAR